MPSQQSKLPYRTVAPAIFAIASLVTAATSPEVPFPLGYRSWQHIKTVVVGPQHKSFAAEGGKVYHFYANPQAVDGYRIGKFPDGSILVRETLRTVPGEGESKGLLTEGERTGVDVMIKNAALYQETAGWGFETFDSKNARLSATATGTAQCYACHAKQKDHDLVFSTLRADADTGTPYPEGYRSWTFLHASMVPSTFEAFGKKPCEKPCTAGIFYFYANDKAIEGLRTGSYPDGAILAEEMLEWLSPSGASAREGQRRLVGVMVKDSQRYSSTAGWGYGSFDDGSRLDKLDAKARETCHQCHVARKDQGYVFATYKER